MSCFVLKLLSLPTMRVERAVLGQDTVSTLVTPLADFL